MDMDMGVEWGYPLETIDRTMERSTFFNGKTREL